MLRRGDPVALAADLEAGRTMRVLLFIMVVLATRVDACSFVALLAQDGVRLADVDADAAPFYDFLQSHALPPNDDGYGLVYYSKPVLDPSQTFYATGAGVWYLHNDAGALDKALAAVRDPDHQALLALGHARNGSGGTGSHPFTFTWRDRTFSFMHNGDLSNGAGHLKEALLFGLVQSGWFATLPPSRWSNWQGDPADVDSWIDSELLFHYLLSHILDADGDVVAGLSRALLEEDYFGFDVSEDFRSADPALSPPSIINFVLSDGQALYVFRNSRRTDESYQLSYRVFPGGLIGVLTGSPAGSQALEQDELVVIPPLGRPARLAMGNPHRERVVPTPPTDAGTGFQRKAPRQDGAPPEFGLLSAYPNPCNSRTTIHLRLDEAADVQVAIFDVQGRRVAILFEGQLSAGERELSWQGQRDTGESVASGIYTCVLTRGQTCQSTKILLIK